MAYSGLVVFALALLVAAGSPGPTVAALVARVVGNGLRDVLPFLAAVWLGELVWLTAAVAGLSALAQTLGPFFVVLKFVGAAYLVTLAWQMWFAPPKPADERLAGRRRPWRMFGAGLAVSLGNPKNMVFYLALLPTLVDLGRTDLVAWAELSLTALIVLAGVDLAWALAASRARTLLRSSRAMRIANRTGAAAMAGAAVAVATR